MDPVSTATNLDNTTMDFEDRSDPVADLKTQLGHLQIGGGGEMLIDEYDPVDEKPDVAIITPDESSEERDPEPRADDCITSQRLLLQSSKLPANSSVDGAMKARFLPEIQDLETNSETVHTWEIEGWRNLPRKARGPIFECGGHPWYVGLRWD